MLLPITLVGGKQQSHDVQYTDCASQQLCPDKCAHVVVCSCCPAGAASAMPSSRRTMQLHCGSRTTSPSHSSMLWAQLRRQGSRSQRNSGTGGVRFCMHCTCNMVLSLVLLALLRSVRPPLHWMLSRLHLVVQARLQYQLNCNECVRPSAHHICLRCCCAQVPKQPGPQQQNIRWV